MTEGLAALVSRLLEPVAAKRREGPSILLSSLATLLCVGCGGLTPSPEPTASAAVAPAAEPAEEVLRLSYTGGVRTMDPQAGFDAISVSAIRLVFDGLYDYDADGRVVPRLAFGMPAVDHDGRRHVVTLRSDVRFHSGRALTAEDVKATFERLLDPASGYPRASFFSNLRGARAYGRGEASTLEGVQVLSGGKIAFLLEEPEFDFVQRLTLVGAYPVASDRRARGALGQPGSLPDGTGAYRLDSWDREDVMRFVRFERHWSGTRRVAQILIRQNVDRDIAHEQFRRGELHVIDRVPADVAQSLRTDPAFEGRHYEGSTPHAWGIFMNTEMPPFDDVHVRRAVAYAIDRQRWTEWDSGGAHLALGGPVPPSVPGFDEPLSAAQSFDLERARAELRLAGYTDGIPTPVPAVFPSGSRSESYAQCLQADLARIGIRVEVEFLDFGSYLSAIGTRHRAAMGMTGWHADLLRPQDFLELFETAGIRDQESSNVAFFSDAEVDRLLATARTTADAQVRLQLFRRAAERIAEAAPWAFVLTDLEFEVWAPNVEGYRPQAFWSLDVRDVWLSPRPTED